MPLYIHRRKWHTTRGKIIKTFENDVDSDVIEAEMDFLSKKDIGSDPQNWTWVHKPNKDIEIVKTKYILYGPVTPEIRKGKFTFPDKLVHEYMLELQKDA